jgi:hypothetical protein
MRIRNVLQEFEAHLQPVQPGTRTYGKSEWRHYADGTVRIRSFIRNIPLPNISAIDLVLDGAPIAQLQVQDNKAKIDLDNLTGQGIPAVRAGQTLQIRSK